MYDYLTNEKSIISTDGIYVEIYNFRDKSIHSCNTHQFLILTLQSGDTSKGKGMILEALAVEVSGLIIYTST